MASVNAAKSSPSTYLALISSSLLCLPYHFAFNHDDDDDDLPLDDRDS